MPAVSRFSGLVILLALMAVGAVSGGQALAQESVANRTFVVIGSAKVHGGNVQIAREAAIKEGLVMAVARMTEEILKVAEEEQVDLMIMGCNGKSGLDRLVSGCVTKYVERQTNVPVMVAKAGGCKVKDKPCDVPVGLEEVYNAG